VTPVLGDIPILGMLFRSVRYQRKETELVVLVTPRIVEALDKGQVPRLPGEHWRDPTEFDLFLNRDIGGDDAQPHGNAGPSTQPALAQAPTEMRAVSRYYGEHGFVPTGQPDTEALGSTDE
jgi:pilus assembly protein CpaC